MSFPLNGRIAIVDDKIEQAQPLIKVLSKKQYPFTYYVTEYLASPNFVRKYDKRNKNLTTLSSVVFCYFCEVKF